MRAGWGGGGRGWRQVGNSAGEGTTQRGPASRSRSSWWRWQTGVVGRLRGPRLWGSPSGLAWLCLLASSPRALLLSLACVPAYACVCLPVVLQVLPGPHRVGARGRLPHPGGWVARGQKGLLLMVLLLACILPMAARWAPFGCCLPATPHRNPSHPLANNALPLGLLLRPACLPACLQGGLMSAFARSVAAHVKALMEPNAQPWDPAEAKVGGWLCVCVYVCGVCVCALWAGVLPSSALPPAAVATAATAAHMLAWMPPPLSCDMTD